MGIIEILRDAFANATTDEILEDIAGAACLFLIIGGLLFLSAAFGV
jgi:hypothetical protein|tara:strand:- start:531 stop:668 length:138 start_codon:yes stop_codon:yes gene_type:complete